LSLAAASILGGISGLTIFLGLPIARIRRFPSGVRSIMPAVATGILIFLLWDVLAHAGDVVVAAMPHGSRGSRFEFAVLVSAFIGALALGLLALVYTSGRMMGRARVDAESPRNLAIIIAGGLGCDLEIADTVVAANHGISRLRSNQQLPFGFLRQTDLSL
jgi:hypothetical protein